MATKIAIHVHCRPGDELICEERSHVFLFEGGGAARLSGTQVRTLVAADGFPSTEQVEDAVRADDDAHYPRSRLLVLENSHNMAGGRVAGVEVPSTGVASDPLSLEDLEANQDVPQPKKFDRQAVQKQLDAWKQSRNQ